MRWSCYSLSWSLRKLLYVSSNFLNKVRAYGDTGHLFIGGHIEFADDVDGRLPAYRWIRDHTPYNSVVLLPLIPTKYSNLFHERMLYVRILQLHFGASRFGYAERVAELDAFYDGTTSGEDYQRLLDHDAKQSAGPANLRCSERW